ncbi:MAG: NAD-dependent deacylase [Dermatophilaceae bacterium]
MPAAQPPSVLVDVASAARRVVVLSGAGMSAESGLATFRDPQTGLWERFRPEDLATPAAWDADPALVWAWYLWRFERTHDVTPNAGHAAIAAWEGLDLATVTVVTQNVDDLHERAGSRAVHHLHGSISAFRCSECDHPFPDPILAPPQPVERIPPPACPACFGLVRPGVVWFGESLPPQPWEEAVVACENAELVLVVGTSGLVYPAAGLPAVARASGAFVAEVNPRSTDISDLAHLCWRESAARAIPALVEAITALE